MGSSSRNHKILIVDDDSGNVNFLRLSFSGDYNVLCARNGKDALKILNNDCHQDIALIMTDQRMPDLCGTGLLKKSLETHPDTIRMIITAFPEVKDCICAINEIHIDKYILKPIAANISELTKIVESAVSQYELKRENDQLIKILKELLKRDARVLNLFSKHLPEDLAQKFKKQTEDFPDEK